MVASRELPPSPTINNKGRKLAGNVDPLIDRHRRKEAKGKGNVDGSSGKYRVSFAPEMVAAR
jgi:hypothetical protein